MKEVRIEELLSRFIDGETSVEEETVLADFFRKATEGDKPADMPEEDWMAYREMFRQFDEGFEDMEFVAQPKKKHWPLRICATAAAVAAAIVMVFMLDAGSGQVSPVVAEVEHVSPVVAEHVDTTTSVTTPADTIRDGCVETAPVPSKKAKPKKQRRLPYTPPVPRHLIAQAVEVHGISEDSMDVALEEAEHLINAMTVYQEIRINEICNVDFEEEY